MTMFETQMAEALELAKAQYPKPLTGLVVEGKFVPLDAPDDLWSPDMDQMKQTAEAVIIMRDKFALFPDAKEMIERQNWSCPWIYWAYDPRMNVKPITWEDPKKIEPILGRRFAPGIRDCYALVRDVFTLGRDALAEQGVPWPYLPYELDAYPHDVDWWERDSGLYIREMKKRGFVEIDAADARPGDVFFFGLHTKHYNHSGVLLEGNKFLHQLPNRYSRIEPPGVWGERVKMWMRCKDAKI